MLFYHYFYKIILYFLLVCLLPCSVFAFDVELVFGQEEANNNLIMQYFNSSFFVESIDYESDVSIERGEFFYLIDLKENIQASCVDIQRSVSRLFDKQKIEKIILTVDEKDNRVNFNFKLIGFWTLEKIKFHGIIIGKDKYRQYYCIDQGEAFDNKKHLRSLKRIKIAFKNEGYFDATVKDEIVKDFSRKAVGVHFYLCRGQRYKVGSVIFLKKENNNKKIIELSEMKKIDLMLASQFKMKNYCKKKINKEAEYVRRCLSKMGFLQVEVKLEERVNKDKKTVDFVFNLNFLKKRKFAFFGNSFFSDSSLLDSILMFGYSAWLVPSSVLGQEIEQEYHKKGFWAVDVDCKEEVDRDFFIINEGKRAIVKKVICRGVKKFSFSEIRKHCFRLMLRKKYFDEEYLKLSLEKIKEFYHSRGFLDMKIINQEFVVLDKRKSTYEFHLVIEEGDRVVIKDISIPAFPSLELSGPFKKFFKKKEKIYFNYRFLKEQKNWLQNYFRKKKRMDVSIKPNFIRDNSNIVIQWIVTEKIVTEKFGKTIVCGSCDFPFERIKRELCYNEGDLLDKKKIKQSIDRLRSLEIFDLVHLYPDYNSILDGKRNILLKLNKDDPFEFRFRAGAGLEQVSRNFLFGKGATYKVGGTFLVKNPANRGDNFIFDADFSRSYRNMTVEYDHPYFLNLPFRFRFKLYANKYEQPGFVGSKKDLYELTQQGLLIGIKEKCRFFDASVSVGSEWMKTDIKRGMEFFSQSISQAICFESDLLGEKIPYFFIEPVLLIDRLDNKLDPSFGTFTLLTFKAMFPFGNNFSDACFIKCMAEQSFFNSFGPFVLALRLRVGTIFYQSFKKIMPFERFYLGGANSIRSYESDMCPPLGCFTDEDAVDYCVPQGGKSMINGNIELRFPLFRLISGVIFQDFGTLINSSIQDFDYSRVFASTGFGFRYNTPIGPLRFDIGWKWKISNPSDYSYAWFLTLGHAF